MTEIEPWMVRSALVAFHNIAISLGGIASSLSAIWLVLAIYPWLGGFGSHKTRNVVLKDERTPR
jgi:hypothetical protein